MPGRFCAAAVLAASRCVFCVASGFFGFGAGFGCACLTTGFAWSTTGFGIRSFGFDCATFGTAFGFCCRATGPFFCFVDGGEATTSLTVHCLRGLAER